MDGERADTEARLIRGRNAGALVDLPVGNQGFSPSRTGGRQGRREIFCKSLTDRGQLTIEGA